MSADVRVAVVGAGVAGLAAAVEATQFGDVVVLEAAGRVGGVIRTSTEQGFVCEHAVAGFPLPASGMSTLVTTTGAGTDLVPSNPVARRRWIYEADGLYEVPSGPPAFLTSRILSPWAKLGGLAEMVTPPFDEPREESVADFVARRFGAEIARRLAQPLIGGIFAGHASRISVDAAFPQLRDLERHGGVIRGGLRRMRLARAAGVPRARLHTMRAGMGALPERLAAWLGDTRVRLNTPVDEIVRVGSGWRVGDLTAEHVVLACPPGAAAGILVRHDPALGPLLRTIPYAPVTLVHLGVEAAGLIDSIGAGFGFLAHPNSGLRILGAVFDSDVFPDRAPPGLALVRALMGGAVTPEWADLDDSESQRTAVSGVELATGAQLDVRWHQVVRVRPGIPQYEIGHRARVRSIERHLAELPGVAVTGWGYRGVGVNGAVADAVGVIRTALGARAGPTAA